MRVCLVVAAVVASLGILLLAAPEARAEIDADKIEAAANRAVSFLKRNQAGQGHWVFRTASDTENNIGCTALVGLALLESDVPRNDAILQAAARTVQNAAPGLKTTYGISCAILFLDRFGDGRANPLVRTLAVRLAAGQSQTDGGWTYTCPILNAGQEKAWLSDLNKFKNVKDFGAYAPGQSQTSDNSNSQFAVLALWVGRVHGVPVEYPLFKAEWRFRATQGADGGWNYTQAIAGANVPNTPSMTCAGLLGLAVAYGAKREQQMAKLRADEKDGGGNAPAKPGGVPRLDIANDPAVLKSKQYLTEALKRSPKEVTHYLYFLWSLERVSVTYRFKDYGGIDWYEFGSNLLINAQKQDGSWELEDGPNIDTVFALLFLRKANLVGDISGTARLKADDGTGKAPKTGGDTAAKPKVEDKNRPTIAEDKAPAEAAKLKAELLTATPARQQEIIEILQETVDKSGNYTQALVDLIPMVKDNLQVRVRAALAERLSRQPADSLRKKLSDEDMEIRIASARALGTKVLPNNKPDTKSMPDLIKLLTHSNEDLAAAAEQALSALTEGKDFGRNAARWQEYYDKLPPSRR